MSAHLTLRQLKAFRMVAREGGIAAAARALNSSPAAISEALSDLEALLGTRLFDRGNRGLTLSAAGRAMLPDADAILDRAAAFAVSKSAGARTLRIGASVTLGNYILPELLRGFRDADGGYLSVVIRNSADIAAALLRHEVELAFVEGNVSDPDLVSRAWRWDELAIFCSPSHTLAGRTATAAELAGQVWMLREAGSGTREVFDRAIAPHFVPDRIVAEVGGNELLKAMVIDGRALGCLSRVAIAPELAAGVLAQVDVPWLDMRRILSVVLQRGGYIDPVLGRFLDHVEANGSPDLPARNPASDQSR